MPVLLAVYLIHQIRDRAHAEYRAQHDALTDSRTGHFSKIAQMSSSHTPAAMAPARR